jgi:hypothetical protein
MRALQCQCWHVMTVFPNAPACDRWAMSMSASVHDHPGNSSNTGTILTSTTASILSNPPDCLVACSFAKSRQHDILSVNFHPAVPASWLALQQAAQQLQQLQLVTLCIHLTQHIPTASCGYPAASTSLRLGRCRANFSHPAAAAVMAALVFKVGALAMKTLAKPLGDRFKNWVMTHPQYRQTVLTAAQVGTALMPCRLCMQQCLGCGSAW